METIFEMLEREAHDRALADQLRQAQTQGRQVRVSGQPLTKYGADGEDVFFDDCERLEDAVCTVLGVFGVELCPRLNPHLNSRYHGDYAVATVVELDTNDEYRIGIRSRDLGTSVEVL